MPTVPESPPNWPTPARPMRGKPMSEPKGRMPAGTEQSPADAAAQGVPSGVRAASERGAMDGDERAIYDERAMYTERRARAIRDLVETQQQLDAGEIDADT